MAEPRGRDHARLHGRGCTHDSALNARAFTAYTRSILAVNANHLNSFSLVESRRDVLRGRRRRIGACLKDLSLSLSPWRIRVLGTLTTTLTTKEFLSATGEILHLTGGRCELMRHGRSWV